MFNHDRVFKLIDEGVIGCAFCEIGGITLGEYYKQFLIGDLKRVPVVTACANQ